MGTSSSTLSYLTEDILEEYVILSYLSKGEILRLFKTFTVIGADQNLNQRYNVEQVEEAFPQLKCNPFKDRICKVFSSHKDNTLSFEDILDLCSVMSEKCPDKVKAAWAFRIFDFDEDGAVGEHDLATVIDRLTDAKKTNSSLDVEDKKHIIRVLLREIDLVDSGYIGELEFQQVVGKMSEFPHSFSFRF